MICRICGGEVLWKGPLSALTHTECQSCGETNCQTVQEPEPEPEQEPEREMVTVTREMAMDAGDPSGVAQLTSDKHD